MRDAHGDIDTFLDQIHHTIDEQRFRCDFGVPFKEIVQDRGKILPSEGD
jgi:hypothetical protein